MLCIYIKSTQQLIELSILSMQSMSVYPLAYQRQFILLNWGIKTYVFLVKEARKDIETY